MNSRRPSIRYACIHTSFIHTYIHTYIHTHIVLNNQELVNETEGVEEYVHLKSLEDEFHYVMHYLYAMICMYVCMYDLPMYT